MVLYGNLAPDGAVAKITGKEGERFTGTARSCSTARRRRSTPSSTGRVKAGRRRRHPLRRAARRPGHARDAVADQRDHGARPGQRRRADHRRPLLAAARHGFVVGHITPEAAVGGPLALVKNGDPITIDAVGPGHRRGRRRSVNWRRAGGPGSHANRATPAACWPSTARLVESASEGAVTDREGPHESIGLDLCMALASDSLVPVMACMTGLQVTLASYCQLALRFGRFRAVRAPTPTTPLLARLVDHVAGRPARLRAHVNGYGMA